MLILIQSYFQHLHNLGEVGGGGALWKAGPVGLQPALAGGAPNEPLWEESVHQALNMKLFRAGQDGTMAWFNFDHNPSKVQVKFVLQTIRSKTCQVHFIFVMGYLLFLIPKWVGL